MNTSTSAAAPGSPRLASSLSKDSPGGAAIMNVNGQAAEAPRSLLKRSYDWLIGSAKKKQRVERSSGTTSQNDNGINNGDSMASPKVNINIDGHHQDQEFKSPLNIVGGNRNVNASTTNYATSSTANVNDNVNANANMISAFKTPSFHIGTSSTSSTTTPSFKRISFASNVKPSTNTGTTNTTGTTTATGIPVRRRGTPYAKMRKPKVQFKSSSDAFSRPTAASTPYKTNATTTYRKTPFKSFPTSTTNFTTNTTNTNSARKRYKPVSKILTGSMTPLVSSNNMNQSKLSSSKLSSNHITSVASQILQKQTLKTPLKDKGDSALFSDPTNTNVASLKVNRVYGSNQSNSRIDASASGNDYWSQGSGVTTNANVNTNANVEGHGNGHGQYHQSYNHASPTTQEFASPTNTSYSSPSFQNQEEDHISQSTKRKKVSFNNLTPPGGKSSKELATPVHVRPRNSNGNANDGNGNGGGNNEKRMPLMSTPFIHSKQTRYVSLEPQYSSSAANRDEEGRVVYSPVEEYGTMMDLGVGAKGVEESDVTLGVVDKLRKGLLKGHYKFGKPIAPVGVNDFGSASGVGKEDGMIGKTVGAVPYDFMPKNETGGRKGSSSLLNKPIDASTPAAAPVVLNSVSAAPAPSAPPVGSGWGNMFALKEGEWKCDVCMTKNPKDAAKCVACTVGVKGGGEAGGQDQIAAPVAAAGSAAKFSFGAPKADDKSAPASTGGFTFGAPKADDKAAPATGGFTFGAPKVDDKKEDKDAPVPATGGFMFGSKPSTTETKSESTPKPTFAFGSTPAPAPTPTPSESKADNAPKPAFSFGSGAVSKPNEGATAAPTPAFAFGSIPAAEKKDPVPAMAFGSIPANEDDATNRKKKRSSDGDTAQPAPASKPAFSFGSGAQPTSSTTDNKPAFSFGAGGASTSIPTPATENKAAFSFGSSSAPPAAPAPAENKPSFSFGSSVTPPPVAGPTFAFGSSAPAVHAPAVHVPAPSGSFAFGSAPAPAPPAAAPFSFGTAAPAPQLAQFGAPPPAAPGGFGFGQQPAAPAPAAPAFGFGAPAAPAQFGAPVAPAQFGGGGFGQPAAVPAPGGFGQPAAVPAPAPGGFGQPATVPAPAPGGFSMGTGGGTKGKRRIIRAKRPPAR